MTYLMRLIFRNLFRQPLRSLLTAVGIVVAITAFGLLRTTVDAWYAGVEASSSSRLVTRNKNSLVFPLPLHYLNKIRQLDGVSKVSYAEWFGGIYIDKKNFFPQFAVDRRGVIVGRKTAAQYGWKIGDLIPLQGTIYPGTWDFVIEGIYRGIDSKTDETQFFFHWEYLNEITKKTNPDNADKIGIFLVGLKHAQDAPLIAQRIDALFANSLAETLAETEKAFQLGCVAMTDAILLVIQAVSCLIILIIMAVMANTMAMAARERRAEYAILKAMGFTARFIVGLILGESLLLSLSAGAAGIVLIFPTARDVGARFGTLFPIFNVSTQTLWMAAGAALLVGVVAGVVPAWRAVRTPVAEGMRGMV